MNVLREEDVNKIVNIYDEYREEEKYSMIIELSEIMSNDYNLNISRYIDSLEEEEENIDLEEVITNIIARESEIEDSKTKVFEHLTKLGLV